MNKNTINDLQYFYTKRIIPNNEKLHYLITIPCVNREERNAIQIIHKTFESFEKNNVFDENSNFQTDILLFESGSNNLSYLSFLKEYLDKYPNKIKISFSKKPLDGPQNIHRLFQYSFHEAIKKYHFIIWMDDDIVVCKNFMFHCDKWIREYMNFTLFGSLYSPYQSYPIDSSSLKPYCQKSFVRSYHGSCCTIFKPLLAKYIIPLWFQTNQLRNVTEPDLRFRESIMKFFPNIQTFLVSKPSLVQHLNIGSAIYQHKQIKKGHHAREFIGEENQPNWLETNLNEKEEESNESIKRNIHLEITASTKLNL